MLHVVHVQNLNLNKAHLPHAEVAAPPNINMTSVTPIRNIHKLKTLVDFLSDSDHRLSALTVTVWLLQLEVGFQILHRPSCKYKMSIRHLSSDIDSRVVVYYLWF